MLSTINKSQMYQQNKILDKKYKSKNLQILFQPYPEEFLAQKDPARHHFVLHFLGAYATVSQY